MDDKDKKPDEQLKEGDTFEPGEDDRLDERVQDIGKPPPRDDGPPKKAA